jgi:hypothetical protein
MASAKDHDDTLLIGDHLQVVGADDRIPNWFLVGHAHRQRRWNWIGGPHVEHRSDFWSELDHAPRADSITNEFINKSDDNP